MEGWGGGLVAFESGRCGGGKPGFLKVETHKVQACQDNEATADEGQSDDEE